MLKVGDLVDARDLRTGAWFEGTVERITEESNGIVDSSGDSSQGETSSDNVLYHVAYDRWMIVHMFCYVCVLEASMSQYVRLLYWRDASQCIG